MIEWISGGRLSRTSITFLAGTAMKLYGSPSKKEKFVRALFLAVEALESISKRHRHEAESGEAEAGPALDQSDPLGPRGLVCTQSRVLRDAGSAGRAALKLRMDDGRWTWTSIHHNTRPDGTSLFGKKKEDLNQVFWEERKRSDDGS